MLRYAFLTLSFGLRKEACESKQTTSKRTWVAAPSGELAQRKRFSHFSRCDHPLCHRSCGPLQPRSTDILFSHHRVGRALLRNCAPRPLLDPLAQGQSENGQHSRYYWARVQVHFPECP